MGNIDVGRGELGIEGNRGDSDYIESSRQGIRGEINEIVDKYDISQKQHEK